MPENTTGSLPPLMPPPWSLDQVRNIGHCLSETASRMPDDIAVACPRKHQPKRLISGSVFKYDTITFGELETRSNQIAMGLGQLGFPPGGRLALMVPPGINFVTHVFGLFKAGAVIILIDPGLGRKNMIRCLSEAEPIGIVGIPLAHLARVLFRKQFPHCQTNIVVDGVFPRCVRSAQFTKSNADEFVPLPGSRENEAAIIFTSGSTGPPKGVLYRHRNFIEQSKQIRDYFQIKPGTVDISGFPLFALFNTAMGVTTVFPQMDPTRPAQVYPPNIIDAVTQFQADQSFGSPALWNTVSNYCVRHSVTLPSIQRILSAGAPVPPTVLKRVKQIIAPDGDAWTPYGATEALPVACNSATIVLNETAARSAIGEGTCVGNRFPDIQWQVIEISDDPIPSIDRTTPVTEGQIGELIVKGPVVSDQYVTRTEANAQHKIFDPIPTDSSTTDSSAQPTFWHRMGDVGYLDSQDRFWFCGRKSHRVRTDSATMFTIPCESIINTHEKIYRSALVGVGEPGQQIPVLIAEPLEEHWSSHRRDQDQLLEELEIIARQHWQTDSIDRFMLHRSLPVDVRHNSKIFREQLREWATGRI